MTDSLFWRRTPILYVLHPRECSLPRCPGRAFISPPVFQFLNLCGWKSLVSLSAFQVAQVPSKELEPRDSSGRPRCKRRSDLLRLLPSSCLEGFQVRVLLNHWPAAFVRALCAKCGSTRPTWRLFLFFLPSFIHFLSSSLFPFFSLFSSSFPLQMAGLCIH